MEPLLGQNSLISGLLTQPQQSFGGFGYAPPIRPNTVLSQPDTQQRLGQAFNQALDDVRTGGSRAQKGEMIATDIFSKIIAPAIGAFGGPGVSQAGNDLVSEARAQVQQQKAYRRLTQQNAFNNAKDLAYIVNSTSPESHKAVADAIKADQKQQQINNTQDKDRGNLAVKQGTLAETQAENQRKDARIRQKLSLLDTQIQNHFTLGSEKNKLKSQEMQQISKRADDRNKIALQIAQLNAAARKYGVDEATKRKMMELSILGARYQQEAVTKAIQANNAVTARLSEIDPKSGQFKHQSADGKPLNLNSYLIDPNQIRIDPDDLVEQGIEPEDAQAAVEALSQAMRGAAAPEVPKQDATGLRAQYGSGIQGALKFYTSLPPDAQKLAREKFKAKFGAYPEDMR